MGMRRRARTKVKTLGDRAGDGQAETRIVLTSSFNENKVP